MTLVYDIMFPELPRVQPELYLRDHPGRAAAAARKPTVEIEVMRDREDAAGNAIGRRRIKRRGILHRAVGHTFWLDQHCYHISEVLAYREIARPGA